MNVSLALLVLAPLAGCPLALWLGQRGARWAQLLALWPLFSAVMLARGLQAALRGSSVRDQLDWLPSVGLTLSFRLDALSAIFALLISGVGACIVVYAAHYFDGHRYAGRFQATLFAFMAAMLGVVLTDNVFALFVFWELTGFTSFLLIGFEHDREEARRSALQALLVTGAGGLCLLAAGALLSQITGSTSLAELASSASQLRQHPLYGAAALLVLLAAFTKSAQFPFHFWLPNAMAAPTPVSAYLHSATMVKAGVYLVARMNPALGGTALWTTVVVTVGALTLLGASLRAVRETDLKRILAYSTVGALGMLFLLLGIGTPLASAAALAYLLAHASYKGSLFLLAGIIEHGTGTRDITQLSGLRRVMPLGAAIGALAAASMAGLPPLLGFLAKEAAYTAALSSAGLASFLSAPLLAGVLVTGSALLGTAGLLAGVAPFVGKASYPDSAHEAPVGLWLAPVCLCALSLGGAAAPLLAPLLGSATSVIAGAPFRLELALWHGWTLPLLLSGVTLALTWLVYRARGALRSLRWPQALGPERLYDAGLRALDAVSARIAPALQDATLASYVLVLVVTSTALTATTLLLTTGISMPPQLLNVQVHELLLALLVMGAALAAVRTRSDMAGVLALSAAGYGVALMFLLYGAPDLAVTQFAVETLTAVIFVFVLWQLPRNDEPSSPAARSRDALVSIAVGGLVSVLTLAAATHPTNSRLRDFYAEAAPTLAHGRNIVNVILVDFRALDTLGEITVLVTAALGVSALLRIAAKQKQERAP
jgi:multicomponent Na+:H+ antiporter subunit A